MKYMTLALIMIAPCLAQASQYVTGILSTSSSGRHSIQEVATDLPHCQSLEDIRSNSSECLEGRTIEVIVPHDYQQPGTNDALENELSQMSGNLVRLTGTFNPFFGMRVIFDLSTHDSIHIISAPAPQPEPCGNYNGVCHHPQPQPEPCGNYNGVCH